MEVVEILLEPALLGVVICTMYDFELEVLECWVASVLCRAAREVVRPSCSRDRTRLRIA